MVTPGNTGFEAFLEGPGRPDGTRSGEGCRDPLERSAGTPGAALARARRVFSRPPRRRTRSLAHSLSSENDIRHPTGTTARLQPAAPPPSLPEAEAAEASQRWLGQPVTR